MKSSNMSEKNGVVSSRGMQASPAVGAKCVKSSGSSFSTAKKRAEGCRVSTLLAREIAWNLPKIMKRDANCARVALSCQGRKWKCDNLSGNYYIESIFLDKSSSCQLSAQFAIDIQSHAGTEAGRLRIFYFRAKTWVEKSRHRWGSTTKKKRNLASQSSRSEVNYFVIRAFVDYIFTIKAFT